MKYFNRIWKPTLGETSTKPQIKLTKSKSLKSVKHTQKPNTGKHNLNGSRQIISLKRYLYY